MLLHHLLGQRHVLLLCLVGRQALLAVPSVPLRLALEKIKINYKTYAYVIAGFTFKSIPPGFSMLTSPTVACL